MVVLLLLFSDCKFFLYGFVKIFIYVLFINWVKKLSSNVIFVVKLLMWLLFNLFVCFF